MRRLVTARRLCVVLGCNEHADTRTERGWMCAGHAVLDWQRSRRPAPPKREGSAA